MESRVMSLCGDVEMRVQISRLVSSCRNEVPLPLLQCAAIDAPLRHPRPGEDLTPPAQWVRNILQCTRKLDFWFFSVDWRQGQDEGVRPFPWL